MSRERLASILVALGRTVRETSPPGDPDELGRWLDQRGLESSDREALLGLGPKRLFLYRTLVQKSLEGAISCEIPRTKARLSERFERDVALYFADEMPRSHYLRDVAFEFVAWATPRWAVDHDLPAFLTDLARHELSAFEVAGASSSGKEIVEPELRLDAAVVLGPSVRVLRYAFPIHCLRDEDASIDPKPTTLLVYRDSEHDIRYLELTPLAGLILDHLIAKEPLGSAIARACGELQVGFPLEESARFFDDLARRGVLLGAAPT